MNEREPPGLNDLQAAVDDAVDDSSKAELAQCARVLATYVALYKHHFGELSFEQYTILGERLADGAEFGEAVYRSGLRELLETLALTDAQGGSSIPGSRTLN